MGAPFSRGLGLTTHSYSSQQNVLSHPHIKPILGEHSLEPLNMLCNVITVLGQGIKILCNFGSYSAVLYTFYNVLGLVC